MRSRRPLRSARQPLRRWFSAMVALNRTLSASAISRREPASSGGVRQYGFRGATLAVEEVNASGG
jgi:hypothetical protein